MMELAKLYTDMMQNFRETLQPGISEREMIAHVYSRVVGQGAEGLLQINVCSGENMNPWRRWPTERRFQDGDMVGMDIHVYWLGGYIFFDERATISAARRRRPSTSTSTSAPMITTTR